MSSRELPCEVVCIVSPPFLTIAKRHLDSSRISYKMCWMHKLGRKKLHKRCQHFCPASARTKTSATPSTLTESTIPDTVCGSRHQPIKEQRVKTAQEAASISGENPTRVGTVSRKLVFQGSLLRRPLKSSVSRCFLSLSLSCSSESYHLFFPLSSLLLHPSIPPFHLTLPSTFHHFTLDVIPINLHFSILSPRPIGFATRQAPSGALSNHQS